MTRDSLCVPAGRSEEANKEFSAAVQMDDTLVKSWALWGEYLEAAFTREPATLATGVSAITCFLHACRHQKENKSRKYLSKVGPAAHRRPQGEGGDPTGHWIVRVGLIQRPGSCSGLVSTL